MIHVIGDSHSLMFFGIQGCLIHHIGPVTMHRIGRDGLNVSNFGISDHDVMIFVFGEIDIRCHVGIQRDRYYRTEEDVINDLADKYFRSILACNPGNNQLIVCSVVPPTDTFFNPDFPFYGTLEDRILLTAKLNSELQSRCHLNNLEFLDIYRNYALENGELNPEIKDESVHISPKFNHGIEKLLFKCMDGNSDDSRHADAMKFSDNNMTVRKAKLNDLVSVHFRCTKEDGALVHSTLNGPPSKFTVGKNEVLAGFERNVIGMKLGEFRKFHINPDEAYGPRLERLVFRFPLEIFHDTKVYIGMTVRFRKDDIEYQGRILSISDTNIMIDANHPLAGSSLIFETQIMDIA